MTRRLQLIIGDDLVSYESGGKEHADADETLVIGIGKDAQHMTLRELDLTKPHADALRAALEKYLRAGHAPGSQPELPGHPVTRPPRPREVPGAGKRPREQPGIREFNRLMREFAASRGIEVPDYGKLAYQYSGELRQAYCEYLEDQAATDPHGPAGVQLDAGRRLGVLPAAGGGKGS